MGESYQERKKKEERCSKNEIEKKRTFGNEIEGSEERKRKRGSDRAKEI